MEQKLQQAESTLEPFALRQQVVNLLEHRQHFTREIEQRFLFLCQRLREKIKGSMPSA